MRYVVYIKTDFGRLNVEFKETDYLKSKDEVLQRALEIIEDSDDVYLKDSLFDRAILYEVAEGITYEDLPK